jgi:hypothetical protein
MFQQIGEFSLLTTLGFPTREIKRYNGDVLTEDSLNSD